MAPDCAPNHLNMDQVITYKEAAGFLKNPLTLVPHPDFAKISALRKHIVGALKQLVCPQSTIHGWSGLVIDPTMYALIESTTPFVLVANPGDFPMYNFFATKGTINMSDKRFEHDKNYYVSFVNVNRA
jgi:hypothetical protein